MRNKLFLSLLVALTFNVERSAAIELVSTGDAAADMADLIADDVSGVTVDLNSASFTITVPGGGTEDSATVARGIFENGITSPGTALPQENQDPNGPTATYAGGLGIPYGICLSTGWVTDFATPSAGRGFGIEGPNNGDQDSAIPPGLPANHEGEASTRLVLSRDEDLIDFAFPTVNPKPLGGDANVLEFEVELTSPGFLRLSFVFASDEYPAWIDPILFPFNDSFIILIDEINIATIVENSVVQPFRVFDIIDCDPLFFENDTAPFPLVLQSGMNEHKIPGVPRYDHEYGGFTKVLTRETPLPLAAGTHTIRIVIQDVGEVEDDQGNVFPDRSVDSCLFIGENSLKLFELAQGDYNGDGIVNNEDYTVWRYYFINPPSQVTFYHGDGNGDGVVDDDDYEIWYDNWGATGNQDLEADFDRDGCVKLADLTILSTYLPMPSCASRFEGDANGDGAVNNSDLTILASQYQPGCDSEGLMAGGGEGDENLEAMLASVTDDEDLIAQLRSSFKEAAEKAERTAIVVLAPVAKSLIPERADANDDGRVDEADFAIIEAALGLKE